MTADLLRDELLRVPGVESADIEGDALTPQGVRVRLSAGVDASAVGEEVQRVLAAHGLRSEMAQPGTPLTVELPEEPVQAPAVPQPLVVESLAKVSIVEGRDGITVRAETTAGRDASYPAVSSGDRLDEAVVAAVAALVGMVPAPVIVEVEDRQVDGTPLVTIVLEVGRDRFAGSSIVEGGRPFAVGRATWIALNQS